MTPSLLAQLVSATLGGQLIPFGLDGKIITSLAMEYPEGNIPYSRYFPLAAGTGGEGVFEIIPFDSAPQWQSIGLAGKSISALTIQHWGRGPADGQRALAAVHPNSGQVDTVLIYEKDVFFQLDTIWMPSDSGLDRTSITRVRAFSSYYYTGHTAPQPIILGGDTGLYYGRDVWSRATYDGPVRVNSIDVALHWFGELAWAAGQQGLSAVALRSTDQGRNWTTFFLPLLIEGEAFSVAINPAYPDTVYVGGYGVLWMTTDGGSSWLPSSLQPPSVTITTLGVDPVWSQVVYAGGIRQDSSFAFYYSKDAGSSWTEVSPPDTQRVAGVSSLAIAHLSDIGDFEAAYAFIGTLGTGVWQFLISGVTGVEEPSNVPDRFHLYQNYPNPFNPVTQIRFEVGGLRFVSLRVYDVLGREVATLVNEVKEPGVYSVAWDARELSSGVYFYRLTAGRFVETKKLLLAE